MLKLSEGQATTIKRLFNLTNKAGDKVTAGSKLVYDLLEFRLERLPEKRDRILKRMDGHQRALAGLVGVEEIRRVSALIGDLIDDQYSDEDIRRAFKDVEHPKKAKAEEGAPQTC